MVDAVQSWADWQKLIKGKKSDVGEKAGLLIRVYHQKQASEIDERIRLLTDIETLCKKYVAEHGAGDAARPPFILLGVQATKQISVITRAQGGWDKIRKIFGPSHSPYGKTNTIQHHQQLKHKQGDPIPTPTSKQNYWLEALDPQHRSWGHMAEEFFNDWMADIATTKNFWDWLDEKGKAAVPGVQYFAPDDRWKYMVIFGDDKIAYTYDSARGVRGNKHEIPLTRLSTRTMSTHFSKIGFAIWVCSPSGVFYTESHVVSSFHHSSFLSGGRVLAAGEWCFGAGKPLFISHKTGHHAATPTNLYSALKLLDQRININRTVLELIDHTAGGVTKCVNARDFLTNGGSVSACPAIVGLSAAQLKESARRRCQAGVDWDAAKGALNRAYPGGKLPVGVGGGVVI